MSFNLKGYSLPLTPKGQSSLVQSVPHYYSGRILCVVFNVGKDNVKKYLPEPLEPYGDGMCRIMINDFVSFGKDNKEMPFVNPARVKYEEGTFGLYCQYKGEKGTYTPYLYVTQDWSMIYGWFFGWPKKIAQVDFTPTPEINPGIKPLGVGTKLRGVVHRHGNKLIDVTLKIEKKDSPEGLPGMKKRWNIRHFPSIGEDFPEIKQLIEVTAWDQKFGDVWSGKATLKLGDSDNEEFEGLHPKEIVGGYYYTLGWIGHKAKLMIDYNKK